MEGAGQAELERAAVAFLRKRGYSVNEPAWAYGAGERGAAARLRQALPLFARLLDWADAAPPAVKPELLACAVPIFMHLFLALVEGGQAQQAQDFQAAHVGTLLHAKQSARAARMLEQLAPLRTPADLSRIELHEQFRQAERATVVVSPLVRDLFHSRLLSADFVQLADIFQRRAKVVLPEDSHMPALVPEGLEEELSAVNAAKIKFEVDPMSPPMAYGPGTVPQAPPPAADGGAPTEPAAQADVASAASVQSCGLPVPKPDAQARVSASRHFADLLAKRSSLAPGRLPSSLAYIVDGVDDCFGEVTAMAISSDGRYCAATTARGTRLWDLSPSGADAPPAAKGEKPPPASQWGAAGGSSEEPGLLPAARLDKPYRCHSLGQWSRALSASFSLDASMLLTGSQDGTVQLWNAAQGKAMSIFSRTSDPIWALEWCPIDHYFVSSGSAGQGLLWSVERSSPVRLFGPLGQRVPSALTTADVEVVRTHPSMRFAAFASDETTVLYDFSKATPARVLSGSCSVSSLAFSPDGKLLAAGCADGGIQLWDLVAGKRYAHLKAHSAAVSALDFSWPTANSPEAILFSGSHDGTTRLWPVGEYAGGASRTGASAKYRVAGAEGRPAQVVAARFTLANLLLVAGVAEAD